MITFEPKGATYTLACGHKVWLAGLIEDDFFPGWKLYHDCPIYPCYQPEIYFGH